MPPAAKPCLRDARRPLHANATVARGPHGEITSWPEAPLGSGDAATLAEVLQLVLAMASLHVSADAEAFAQVRPPT